MALSAPKLKEMLPAEAEFLYRLCEATMKEYVVAVWGEWPAEKVRAGLSEELDAGRFKAVFMGNTRVGAISVLSLEDHLQLEQLFILPEFQNRGIGSALIKQVVAHARSIGQPVRLRVLAPNPSRVLYERLGFRVIESNNERYFMEHTGKYPETGVLSQDLG